MVAGVDTVGLVPACHFGSFSAVIGFLSVCAYHPLEFQLFRDALDPVRLCRLPDTSFMSPAGMVHNTCYREIEFVMAPDLLERLSWIEWPDQP